MANAATNMRVKTLFVGFQAKSHHLDTLLNKRKGARQPGAEYQVLARVGC